MKDKNKQDIIFVSPASRRALHVMGQTYIVDTAHLTSFDTALHHLKTSTLTIELQQLSSGGRRGVRGDGLSVCTA